MILLLFALIGAVSIIVFTFKNGISPMPSSRAAIDEMVDFTQKASPKVIHELGCGWGGLARSLALACPNSKVIAVENSWLPFAVSWLRLSWLRNVRVVYGDFLKMDLTQCEWVVTYLFRGGMKKLSDKLGKTTVISNAFTIRGLNYTELKYNVFVYYLK